MDHIEYLSTLFGEDLAREQLMLEAESYRVGALRFHAAMDYKASAGQAADTNVARPLISSLIPRYSEEVVKFLQDNASGRPGRKAAAFSLIREMDTEKIAFIAIRAILNGLADPKNNSKHSGAEVQTIIMTVGREIEAEARFGRIRSQDEKYFAKAVAPQIKKRSSDFYKKAIALSIETSMVEKDGLEKWDRWGNTNRSAVGLKCIEWAINIGLVRLDNVNKGTKLERQILLLSEEASEWLANRRDFMAQVSPVWQPMVVPPRRWRGLKMGGYWGRGTSQPSLVRGIRRSVQKRYRDVDLTNVLNAVNVIQETPWKINQEVLKVAKEVANWDQVPVKDMASHKVTEQPERIAGMDEDPKLLKQWKREAARKFRGERARRSRRMSLEQTLETAQAFSKYERIWFPHNVDFRGRVYAIPGFSPQGTDVTKGLLLLADPKPMGERGEYWLRMHIANTAGMDKAPMDQRQQWTHDNEDLIMETADHPLDNLWWASESDSPFCFLAACMEFAKWKRSENPEEYLCGIAVAFDGTCSGIQHFSAMLKDEVGGMAVNLIPSDRPQDIYRIVADKVNEVLQKDSKGGSEDLIHTDTDEETGEISERVQYGSKSVASWWLKAGVTRSVTKRSVMTLPYGSKKFGFSDQLMEDIIGPLMEAQGEHVFPAPSLAARYLADLIWKALETTVVAAVEAMAWLQKAAGALGSQGMGAHWVTPVGFPVWQEYRVPQTRICDTIICGSIRVQLSFMKDEPQDGQPEVTLDKRKQVSAISPNFVHSMDGSHLMLTALKGKSVGIDHFAMIHDSYGTCPGSAQDLFRIVRETFVETYSTRDVIQDFHDGFSHLLTAKSSEKIPSLPPKGSLVIEDIMNSLYCFS